MNTSFFSSALSQLDEKYIEEALSYPRTAKHHWWVKLGAAACFALVFTTVLFLSSSRSGQSGVTSPGLPPAVITTTPVSVENSPSETPGEPQPSETIHIDLGNIVVNRNLDAMPDAARIYYDPELYDEVLWDQEDVIGYYGRDLIPSWVPDGLTALNPEAVLRAQIRKEDGTVAEDTLHLSFYQVYGTWDDGSPRLIDENTVRHGFTLSASKVGLFNCGIVYVRLEDAVKASDIAGTPVTIGYRAMPYGPYDPETHEPAGYYDLYVAEFTLNDIKLQVVAEQMELEDVIKVVVSIIQPNLEIVFEQ